MSAYYLQVALDLAAQKFNGKADKAGEPYIFHCIEVERMVAKWPGLSSGARIVGRCAALLHDIFEDTDTTYDEVVKAFGDYGESIALTIATLTRRRDETYAEYIDRVARVGSEIAIIIKWCDLTTNLDVSRLPADKAEEFTLVSRYVKARARIGQALNAL